MTSNPFVYYMARSPLVPSAVFVHPVIGPPLSIACLTTTEIKGYGYTPHTLEAERSWIDAIPPNYYNSGNKAQ